MKPASSSSEKKSSNQSDNVDIATSVDLNITKNNPKEGESNLSATVPLQPKKENKKQGLFGRLLKTVMNNDYL